MIKKTFKEAEAMLKGEPQIVAVACAESEDTLLAVDKARETGIIKAILVGDSDLIKSKCKKNNIDHGIYKIIDEKDKKSAAAKAVKLVKDGKAQLLMKGHIDTADFLKAVLSKETGIRTGESICSVVALECRTLGRIIITADIGINIEPDLKAKSSIIRSCVKMANVLGEDMPKVAVLCAHEKVNPEAMPITAEASLLSKMSERGQLGCNCIAEGPISLDLAVDERSAAIKDFKGSIRGDADVLLMPDLEAGNILVKGLVHLSSDVQIASVGMGAAVPLIITSRGDDFVTKYNAISMACLVSQYCSEK